MPRFVPSVVFAVLIAALAGCGTAAQNTAPKPAPTTSAPANVKITTDQFGELAHQTQIWRTDEDERDAHINSCQAIVDDAAGIACLQGIVQAAGTIAQHFQESAQGMAETLAPGPCRTAIEDLAIPLGDEADASSAAAASAVDDLTINRELQVANQAHQQVLSELSSVADACE